MENIYQIKQSLKLYSLKNVNEALSNTLLWGKIDVLADKIY